MLTTPASLDTKDFDTLTDIPQELQKYLEFVEKPRETLTYASQTREERLRLLTRRFFNQIQHGCKNTSCNVPTCLSYRKRIAGGPVRPHNDVTARALALRCLEQYASRGRDVAHNPREEKSRKRLAASHLSEDDGLCRSEPVIPWYTDARVHLAETRSAASRDSDVRLEYTKRKSRVNGTVPVPKPIPSGNWVKHTNGYIPVPVVAPVDPPLSTIHDGLHGDISAGSLDPHPKAATSIPSPDDNDSDEPKEVPADPASFAQFLHCAPSLRAVDTASHDTNGQSSDYEATESAPTAVSLKAEVDAGATIQTDRTAISRIYTFKLLPLSAVAWLRSLVMAPSDKSPASPSIDRVHVGAILDQTLYHVFNDPERLVASCRTWNMTDDCKELLETDPAKCMAVTVEKDRCMLDTAGPYVLPNWKSVITVCVMILQMAENRRVQELKILAYLTRLLRYAYILPSWFVGSLPSSKAAVGFHSNRQVAHLLALITNISHISILAEDEFEPKKLGGRVSDQGVVRRREINHVSGKYWYYEHYQPALMRLLVSIADVYSHRFAIDAATRARREDIPNQNLSIYRAMIDAFKQVADYGDELSTGYCCTVRLIEYMQAVIVARWDRSPIVTRKGPVGGALQFLRELYKYREVFELTDGRFQMPELSRALDEIEMPWNWLHFKPDSENMHILQFSFLFFEPVLVGYFRSLNLRIMKNAHEKAMSTYTNGKAQLLHGDWRVNNVAEVLDLTRVHMAPYFVMTIRREHMLEDAIGQIWRRQRQELLRPLKVRLGVDQGELGLDHGGVQQEFFRLVFAEAFDPSRGMFDTDPSTRMSWFKPGSLEPLYKFEALGILVSLAAYNGVTVPVSMPIALYRKILGLKVKKLEHVEDGWPELVRNLRTMLEWEHGDVGDVMSRTYEFSYDAFGTRVNIDMSEEPDRFYGTHDPDANQSIVHGHPQHRRRPCGEAPLVTNANREAYIKDYIFYLTDKTVAKQFEAFLKGVRTLLSAQALALLSPATLKSLIEGRPTSQAIDVSEWQAVTTYEDYERSDAIIEWFWEVLRDDLSQPQLRSLLEFVTASDRLPVNGWDGITFIIMRNAAGDQWLPGSSTCYGRLHLPEYSSKEVLKEKLTKAIESSVGFGQV